MSKFEVGTFVQTDCDKDPSITLGRWYMVLPCDSGWDADSAVAFFDDKNIKRHRVSSDYHSLPTPERITAAEVRRRAHKYPLPTGESDPNGLDPHAPGAKVDAGKLRPGLILDDMASAIRAVVKVGTDGANKYSDGGWMKVDNGFARYGHAKLRHQLSWGSGETHDKDTGSLHLAHEAWNALARLELYLKNNPKEKV